MIVPRSNRVDMDQVMNHLFATTDWKRAIALTLNIGLDGRPAVKKPAETLPNGWCSAAIPCAAADRTIVWRSPQAPAYPRSWVLLVALVNIDEVIEIIRNEDEPKPALMSRFGLTETLWKR